MILSTMDKYIAEELTQDELSSLSLLQLHSIKASIEYALVEHKSTDNIDIDVAKSNLNRVQSRISVIVSLNEIS